MQRTGEGLLQHPPAAHSSYLEVLPAQTLIPTVAEEHLLPPQGMLTQAELV